MLFFPQGYRGVRDRPDEDKDGNGNCHPADCKGDKGDKGSDSTVQGLTGPKGDKGDPGVIGLGVEPAQFYVIKKLTSNDQKCCPSGTTLVWAWKSSSFGTGSLKIGSNECLVCQGQADICSGYGLCAPG